MYRYGSIFTGKWHWFILFIFLMSCVIDTTTERPDPESKSTSTDTVGDDINNNETDPLQRNQTDPVEINGQPGSSSGDGLNPTIIPAETPTEPPTGLPAYPLTSSPPTGPNTPTKQPFHALATGVDYFGYDGYSEEVVEEGTGVEGDVGMDTTTEPVVNDTTRCQCATDDNATSTTTATAVGPPPPPPPVNEVALLEKAIQSICSRLRRHVAESARNESDNLVDLRDTCSVKLEYNFNRAVKQPDGFGEKHPQNYCFKAGTRLTSTFGYNNETGKREWKELENEQRRKKRIDRFRTKLENIEKNVTIAFQP